jgi:hypothetical protein
MNQDKRPDAAIGEAKRKAVTAGFRLIEMVRSEELEFDFAAQRDGVTSLIRVRRLKHAGFRVENIQRSCARQIRQLRDCTLFPGSDRELWVRGPARGFHRFRVLPETLEELGDPGTAPAPAATGELPETGRVPWYEMPIGNYSGEVQVVPYVQWSPAKRARLDAMFRGYARYRVEMKNKVPGPENPGPGAGDPGGETVNPGTTARDPEPGPGDTGAAGPV